MKTIYVGVLLGLMASSGCQRVQEQEPTALPTVKSDGTLVMPADYQPQPDIDLSRVDCQGYLEMNPTEIRDMARDLCMQSKTEQEHAANPYCQIQKVTEACLARSGEGSTQ